MKRVKRFAVLGNISSGKSSLVRALKLAIADSLILDEPIKLWRDTKFLPAFCSDMKRYGLAFQMFAFATRQAMHKDIDETNLSCVIADAHVYTDRHVFAQNLVDGGFITKEELEWYEITFDKWQKLVPESSPDLFIYLKTSPKTCYDRMKKRIIEEGRTEESAYSMEYLSGLHTHFQRVLDSPECTLRNVVVIDADKPAGEVLNLALNEINKHLKPADDVC